MIMMRQPGQWGVAKWLDEGNIGRNEGMGVGDPIPAVIELAWPIVSTWMVRVARACPLAVPLLHSPVTAFVFVFDLITTRTHTALSVCTVAASPQPKLLHRPGPRAWSSALGCGASQLLPWWRFQCQHPRRASRVRGSGWHFDECIIMMKRRLSAGSACAEPQCRVALVVQLLSSRGLRPREGCAPDMARRRQLVHAHPPATSPQQPKHCAL